MGRSGCDIPLSVAVFEGQGIPDLLVAIGEQAEVDVLVPASVLCGAAVCRTRQGDAILYVDQGHLTHEGARHVVEGLGLREALIR
ncbi:MAG TPA: hypothetical protein DCX75_13390 [Brevundimonas sp.]|jgi:hypothetical protein|nr:hypothetical protein [Brevundimonas sp.]HAJ02768.1 hypothetical protein [Brevundimonas sp.]HAV51020.1 hypothetical protein [Brevundimonas sp.]|tara:strand:+ start:15820 stop:16074 length:255 start_codon:yes stop_codon:yes gene_type:complete